MKKYLLIMLLIIISSCQVQDEKIYSINKDKQDISTIQIKPKDTTINEGSVKTGENFIDTIENKTVIDTALLNRKIVTRATYQANHINSLRKAIDLYNSNQSLNMFLTKFAFDGQEASKPINFNLEPNSITYSFNQLYNEGYLSGKFILVNLSEEKDGKINVDIMFQHKQDKIFRFAMSYNKKRDIFVINAVFIPKKYDEQTVKFYRRLYSIYLNDDNFGV